MAGDVHSLRGDLPRDGHQRRAVRIGVRHAGDQVRRTGAERGQADAGLSRQPAVYIRHKRGALLVTGGDEADGRGGQRLDDLQILLAGNAEYDLHALCGEALNQFLGNVHADSSHMKEGGQNPCVGTARH